jgi:hypothetical protein
MAKKKPLFITNVDDPYADPELDGEEGTEVDPYANEENPLSKTDEDEEE